MLQHALYLLQTVLWFWFYLVKANVLKMACNILQILPLPSHYPSDLISSSSLCSSPQWLCFSSNICQKFLRLLHCISLSLTHCPHNTACLVLPYPFCLGLKVTFSMKPLITTLKNWIPPLLHDLTYFLALFSFIHFFAIREKCACFKSSYVIYLSPNRKYHKIRYYLIFYLRLCNQCLEDYVAYRKHPINMC